MLARAKEIFILAGPNGAGKTTFARELLTTEAGPPPFVNADLIAAELSPADPVLAAMRAGRLMLQRIAEHVERGDSFAFETTLADRGFSRSIKTWQHKGYYVTLWFLALPNIETALQRVAQRVQQGGHRIPEDVVRRRFIAGRANFDKSYRQIVDAWLIYDNSGLAPALLDWGEKP